MKVIYGLILFLGIGLHSCQSQKAPELLDPLDFSEMISYDLHAIVLDVRTPEEYAEGHIPRSKNMDFYADDFEAKISKLDKDKYYFLYCAVGGRSGEAASLMHKKGFSKVHDLNGGIDAWETEGLPITTAKDE